MQRFSARVASSLLALAWLQTGVPDTTRADDVGPQMVIVVDLVVEDAARKPITNLKRVELEVFQDGEIQAVSSFKARGLPGHYEISYTPRSGKAGGVIIRVVRAGARVRGPDGDFLKPHIVQAPSPLEAELERVLDARATAADLRCHIAVLHFEPRPDGLHQTIAVEVPSSEVRYADDNGQKRGHLQILVRVTDENERVVRRITLDRPLQTDSVVRVGSPAFERLVWTGNVHLPAGSYKVDTLVFEPESGRATTKRLSLTPPAPQSALQVSSVTVLQPREFQYLAAPTPDDPFVVSGEPVMPTLELTVAAGASAQVRFFVTIYPDPNVPEPPTLALELRRGEEIVGSVPLKLPPPGPGGEIRYVGLMPTRTFRAADYVLRVIARQGGATASETTSFKVAPAELPTP